MQSEWMERWHGAASANRKERHATTAMYVVGALTPILVFVLPLFVPTQPARAVSTSYVAGFSNRVAFLSAVALSLAVLGWTWWTRERANAGSVEGPAFARLPQGLVLGVIAATAVVQAFAGWLIITSHQRNLGDAGYIIEQATVRADTGRALYTQIEFAYGPLLLYPEMWLSRLLGCSISSAYFGLLIIQSALGLLMLTFLLNHLPVRAELRKAVFVLVAVAAITPHFGMNYTLFRFASPLFVLLWAAPLRSPWRCTLALSAGMVLELLTSPELGLVLALGALTFGVVRAWQSDWQWLVVAVVPGFVLAVLLMTLGRPYLRMAAIFTRGALNLPVGPYPHVLLLLFALVWLVPRFLGESLDLTEESSARLLALYVASIAFMPAALGRCDPLHVVFNGTGLWVLSATALSNSTPRARSVWIGCLMFVVLWDHRVNDRLFKHEDAAIVREAFLNRGPQALQDRVVHLVGRTHPYMAYLLSRKAADKPLDMAELRRLVGSSTVATPAEISPTVEAQLRQAQLYDPGYFAFWTDTIDLGTEQRVVDYVNAHEFLLLPSSWKEGYLQLPKESGLFQGLNLRYRERKPVLYYPGNVFNENLKMDWTPERIFSSYVLYRHTGHNVLTQGERDAVASREPLQAR